MILCYFCFKDTFDVFYKSTLVIVGCGLIICFCHKLTNYKKSRRYKSSSGLQHQYHQHEQAAARQYYGLPACSQYALDPYSNSSRPPNFTYAGNLLGTPQVVDHISYLASTVPSSANNNNNNSNVDQANSHQYAYLRGPGSSLLRGCAPISAILPHLITNPVYSSQPPLPHQPSGMLAENHHPLSEDAVRAQQPSDACTDGMILDACPSYEEAVAASITHPNLVEASPSATAVDEPTDLPETENNEQRSPSNVAAAADALTAAGISSNNSSATEPEGIGGGGARETEVEFGSSQIIEQDAGEAGNACDEEDDFNQSSLG